MKTNIQRQSSSKKYLHRLPSEVTTTSQFGFYQPNYLRECAADDTVSLRTACAVRLQPVVKPTFGRLMIKQYHNFVPMEEIWHAWGSFLKGSPYNGAINGSYVPLYSPTIPLCLWNIACMMLSHVQLFDVSSVDISDDGFTFVDPIVAAFPLDQEKDKYVSAFRQMLTDSGLSEYIVESFVSYYSDHLYNRLYVNEPYYQEFKEGSFDFIVPLDMDSTRLLCGRFTDAAKNLRKIVIGLGAQLTFDNTEFDLMRFVAYYKTWFDMFAVQRDVTWKDTNIYGYMEYIEQSGNNFNDVCRIFGSDEGVLYSFFKFIFKDLPTCYYNENPSYVSAHITGSGVSSARSQFNGMTPSTGFVDDVVAADPNEQPLLTPSGGDITQSGLDILKQMYKYTNTLTAIGGRIKEFMQSIFGSDYKQDDESYFIGASTTNIDINDVMSTNESDSVTLGEYAGQGKGASQGYGFKYECRRAGYLVSGFCIVPDSRLVQGVDPNGYHREKFDYYTPKFDSITLVPSRKSLVYSNNNYLPTRKYDGGFGNIPNYMEYKQSLDRINGDVSMVSTMSSLLPFSFGKLLSIPEALKYDLGDEHDNYQVILPKPSIFVAGDVWRSIGRYRWLGNYDRIFVNSGFSASVNSGTLDSIFVSRVDDNFVCYFYNDVVVTGYELPVADSFQTDAFDGLSIEKA